MHPKNHCNDIADLFDLDLLDPTLAFTPTTMTRMENTLMNLDGAYDEDSDSDSLTTDDSNQEWAMPAPSTKKQKTANGQQRQLPGPKSSRRIEDMTPEEINRRHRRRERNKAAAARCRQRRLDITNELLAETQQLEAEGQRLEREIENLRKQRDQLEFVLESHKPMCHGECPDNMVKPEPVSDIVMSMNMMPAVRPSSLSIGNSLIPSTLNYGAFDLGSTGVTPVVSASGLNLFMGTGTDFMSPTTLLGSPAL